MFGLRQSTIFPIGVAISHDCVRMIQLHRVANQLSVAARSRLPLPVGSTTAAIAEMVRREINRRGAGFKGKHVVAALPAGSLHLRSIRVSVDQTIHLPTAIRREAAEALPFDPQDATLQYILAGQVQRERQLFHEAIVLAARKSDIDSYLQLFQNAGLLLEALDVEACALYRTVGRFVRRRDDEGDMHALLDIGWHQAQLVIGRGREISFIKLIDLGGRHLQETLVRKLGVTAEEADVLRRKIGHELPDTKDSFRQAVVDALRGPMEQLAREVALCLRYHAITFRGQRLNSLRLSGAEAGDWLSVLQRMLPLSIELAKVFGPIEAAAVKGDFFMSEWALAFGLSLKCIRGSYGPRDGKAREPLRGNSSPDGIVDMVDACAQVK